MLKPETEEAWSIEFFRKRKLTDYSFNCLDRRLLMVELDPEVEIGRRVQVSLEPRC